MFGDESMQMSKMSGKSLKLSPGTTRKFSQMNKIDVHTDTDFTLSYKGEVGVIG